MKRRTMIQSALAGLAGLLFPWSKPAGGYSVVPLIQQGAYELEPTEFDPNEFSEADEVGTPEADVFNEDVFRDPLDVFEVTDAYEGLRWIRRGALVMIAGSDSLYVVETFDFRVHHDKMPVMLKLCRRNRYRTVLFPEITHIIPTYTNWLPSELCRQPPPNAMVKQRLQEAMNFVLHNKAPT